MKTKIVKYSLLFASVFSLLWLQSCNNEQSQTTSSNEPVYSAELKPLISAIDNLNTNFVIQVLEENPNTSKMYYADYISTTENAVFYHSKGSGYLIPSIDNDYLHYFEQSGKEINVYGRVNYKEALDDYNIYSLLKYYGPLFTYNKMNNYFDLSNENGVYEIFKYFEVEFNIDAYGTGSNVWITLNDDGNIKDLHLLEVTEETAYYLYSYHFNKINSHSISLVDSFNNSGNPYINRISDLKGLDNNNEAYYDNETVKFTGVVGASVGNTYIIQDNNGLGIKVNSTSFGDKLKVGNEVSIKGDINFSNLVVSVENVSEVTVNSKNNEVVVLTDDLEEYGRYGFYASTAFYVYPQYSGSMYNTGFAITGYDGNYDINEDLVVNFIYPDVVNNEGNALQGELIISKELDKDIKQMMKNLLDNNKEGDRFVVSNIVGVYDLNQIYNIAFEVTNQTYMERDLTLEEKMVVYLGQEVSLPLFSEGCYASYIGNKVFARDDVERENLTIVGVYFAQDEEENFDYRELIDDYLNQLSKEGFSRYDHFGNYQTYEFYCYVKGESVIEFSFLYEDYSRTVYLQLCLYKGTPIVPISTKQFISDVCGDSNFVLPENTDNHSFMKYKYENLYGSDIDACVLYHRTNESVIDEYKEYLVSNGYQLSNEIPTYKSRNRIHYVYVKDDHYIDIVESLKEDYMHGKNLELEYRLEIITYIASNPVKVKKSNDFEDFFEAINEDALLDFDGFSVSKYLPNNFTLPEGVESEVYFTRNTFGENEPLTGGYMPSLYIYCVEKDGSYEDSINEILELIDKAFIDEGYIKQIYPESNYYPKGAINYSITPPGFMYAAVTLTVTVDEVSGLILIRGL